MGNQFLHKLEEKWQVKSKIYIALKASILQAFEDENIEDIKKHIKSGLWSTVCNETDLVDTLKKHPKILLEDKTILENLWFRSADSEFHSSLMELILDINPELLTDDIEDFIIAKLKNPEDFPLESSGMPIFFQFCCQNKKAFEKLCEVLVQYVFETDFDTRMVELSQKMANKIHENAKNPILLYPSHLQSLVVLLLSRAFDQYSQLISRKLLKLDPADLKIISVLFLPWLKIILVNDPNYHLYFQFFRI